MAPNDLPHASFTIDSFYRRDSMRDGAMHEAIGDAIAAAAAASLKPPKFGTHQGVDLDKLLTGHVHAIAAVYVARTGFVQYKNGIVPRARVVEIKSKTDDHATLRVTVGLFNLFEGCDIKSRVATFSITLPTTGFRTGDKAASVPASDWAIGPAFGAAGSL